MSSEDDTPTRVRWARLRFSIVGPLLHSPPEDRELAARLSELASQAWKHPTAGDVVRFSFKTIERWYYLAKSDDDPMRSLERKVPKHAGTHPAISPALGEAIERQYRDHPRWSYQLHHDNLVVLAREDPRLGRLPGYATIRRYMRDKGLVRSKRRPREEVSCFAPRETRSYEVTHVHGLWHLDFHQCSRAVLRSDGSWKKPLMLGVLDDHSRLCCHGQWYLDETAEALVHGLSQGIQKRGRPRALLTDNGAAMLAAETTEGLERLGIVHRTTLPYSPEQNGKQESFWGQIEGRLLPMLEGEPALTLAFLNKATQAFLEGEYNRKRHSEIGETPTERLLRGPSVRRDSPSSDELRRAFRTAITRTQRRSDGTTTVSGVRFEVPSAYRTLTTLRIHVARWDLSSVDLVDPRTGVLLAKLLPLDKARNAEGVRRTVPAGEPREPRAPSGVAPLLRSLLADYAATGLPPAYLPRGEGETTTNKPQETESK